MKKLEKSNFEEYRIEYFENGEYKYYTVKARSIQEAKDLAEIYFKEHSKNFYELTSIRAEKDYE